MTERAIFEAAIEITNTVKREAFLNEACAGDAALRERLDVLLASHGKPVPERPRRRSNPAVEGRSQQSDNHDAEVGYSAGS